MANSVILYSDVSALLVSTIKGNRILIEVIEEKDTPIEDQYDTDELDTEKTSKNKVFKNLKSAGVFIVETQEDKA